MQMDMAFFLRPFTTAAWLTVVATAAAACAAATVPYAFLRGYEHYESHTVSSTAGWICFTLINAYYGGALTMFFTSDIAVPFETIEEVMAAAPTWTLQFLKGNDIYFFPKADAGNELYREYYYERALVDPGRWRKVFNSIFKFLTNLFMKL